MQYLILILAVTLFISCNEKIAPNKLTQEDTSPVEAKSPVLRSIGFYGSNNNFSIMLNNGRGYLREGDSGNDKTSIPPKEIESLIDAFYDIPDIMKFKGTKEDDRQSKKHYLLMVYDDVRKMDFVDFVIPREYVNTNNELKLWIETMELTQQNKAANKSQ